MCAFCHARGVFDLCVFNGADERFRTEHEYASHDYERDVYEHVRIITEAEQPNVLSRGDVRFKCERTGKHVANKAHYARDNRTEREFELGQLFQALTFAEQTCKPYGGERHGVIEQELRRVNQPGVLYSL